MTPSDVVVSIFATIVLVLTCAVLRPHHVRCPSGWRVDGVTASGAFTCDQPHGCRDSYSDHGGWSSRCDGMTAAGGQVYCTGGSVPINVGGVVVSCQARH